MPLVVDGGFGDAVDIAVEYVTVALGAALANPFMGGFPAPRHAVVERGG